MHSLVCMLPILDEQITIGHIFMEYVSQSIIVHGTVITPSVILTVKHTSLFLLCWLMFALRQDHHAILHLGFKDNI